MAKDEGELLDQLEEVFRSQSDEGSVQIGAGHSLREIAVSVERDGTILFSIILAEGMNYVWQAHPGREIKGPVTVSWKR